MEQTFEDDNCDSDDLADKLKKLSVYDEISMLLPKVIESLEESGHLDSYLKYNELLASGRLPFDNICYLLFLDVVEWFSTENTSKMRYKFPQTVQFWNIGSRLFHRKFLQIMSGPRSFGQTLDGSSEKGCFDCHTPNKLKIMRNSFVLFVINFLQKLARDLHEISSDRAKICQLVHDRMFA